MRLRPLPLLALAAFTLGTLQADNAADAVSALAQLTDPARLSQLPDAAFAAQLGPALGWLHVARRRDISPEAVIARAFQTNSLNPERARLTKDALLRNLARADDWQLFQYAGSAQALALGQPARIASGIHQGHFAIAAQMPSERTREFADLILRADDEPPLRPLPHLPIRSPRPDEQLASRPSGRRRARSTRPAPVPSAPIVYDDALPTR